jgi:hypothetical protein
MSPPHECLPADAGLDRAPPQRAARLRWRDVDFSWGTITIRDTVDGEPIFSLSPYVTHLLDSLPRVGDWEFVTYSAAGEARAGCALVAMELRRPPDTLLADAKKWSDDRAAVRRNGSCATSAASREPPRSQECSASGVLGAVRSASARAHTTA